MEDTVVVNGSAHFYVHSALAREFSDSSLADYISAPAPSFYKVEPRFINKYIFMQVCFCI